MTLGGKPAPVYVVTDAQITSGEFSVEAGPAIVVSSMDIADRGISGGDAIPVYPVDAAYVDSHGIRGGLQGTPIVNATAFRKVGGIRRAIPVFVTHGSLVATEASVGFPDWDLNPYTINEYVLAAANLNYVQTEDISTFGTIAGSAKWYGGVLAPNGFIYGIPSSATTILKINPADDSYTTFGTIAAGSNKWRGAALAANGCIYCIPFSRRAILKIDTSNDTVSEFSANLTDGAYNSSMWAGGVLGLDGFIYGAPDLSANILKIDPTNDTHSLIPLNDAVDERFFGAVLAPNGCIYFAPWGRNWVLKFNPATSEITNLSDISSLGTAYKTVGGALAPNGCIYFSPARSNSIVKVNTATDETSFIGDFGTTAYVKWSGATLAPNGYIYCTPQGVTQVLRINPADDSTELIGSLVAGTTKWVGATLAPNGSIYGIPHSATTILKILSPTAEALDENYVLSRTINKAF